MTDIDTDLIMAYAEIASLKAELAARQRMLNAAIADIQRMSIGGYNQDVTTDYLLANTNDGYCGNVFGDRLKELRTTKRMKQHDLASAIGAKTTTISGYETGYREPNFSMLLKIAELFGVSIDYLLGKTNVMKSHCDVCIGKCYSYATRCDRFGWRGPVAGDGGQDEH